MTITFLGTTRPTETYQCLTCQHIFKAAPGPVYEGLKLMPDSADVGACPKCNSLYVKWLTYQQNFVKKK